MREQNAHIGSADELNIIVLYKFYTKFSSKLFDNLKYLHNVKTSLPRISK